MSMKAQKVLEAFDALSPDDRKEVVAEIFCRFIGQGELSDEALEGLADELFDEEDLS